METKFRAFTNEVCLKEIWPSGLGRPPLIFIILASFFAFLWLFKAPPRPSLNGQLCQINAEKFLDLNEVNTEFPAKLTVTTYLLMILKYKK